MVISVGAIFVLLAEFRVLPDVIIHFLPGEQFVCAGRRAVNLKLRPSSTNCLTGRDFPSEGISVTLEFGNGLLSSSDTEPVI